MTADSANPASRLWRRDASIWHTPEDSFAGISARLGWLNSIDWMRERAAELQAWAGRIAADGRHERAILLGMGGASRAPALFASLFAPAPGYLPLEVIDTTCPDDIARLAAGDLRRCLFIVASKSGSTVETVDLHDFFRAKLAAQCAAAATDIAAHFVIITDAGSPLHRPAEAARIFLNPHDIGGRYSALSHFGLVPAALLGVDIGKLLARARDFCATTKSDDAAENPALALGMLLGRGALAGRDKVILHLPGELAALGLWIEQLLAESTGKDGRGLLPVIAENGLNCGDGADRIHIAIDHGGGSGRGARQVDHRLRLDDPYQVGAECFRWQFATAIAASYLRVNPFDQPDVARSKADARRFLRGHEVVPAAVCLGDAYDVRYHGVAEASHPEHEHEGVGTAGDAVAAFRRALEPRGYLGLLAYLPEEDDSVALLQSLRQRVAEKLGIVATLGLGPRYLHSTGQLHKGGLPGGHFIQFVAESEIDMPVPRRAYTFGQLYRAQADGDFAALARAGRVVMRVSIKADRLRALAAFVAEFVGTD